MDNVNLIEKLIIPVYLNEKTVLDMLAIIEDGFSMVSEVSITNENNNINDKKINGSLSTNTILDKLLRIQISGGANKEISANQNLQTKQEKVHTNVSLLSKFRSELIYNQILSCTSKDEFDASKIKSGDFIELEGELHKNPMIDLLEKFIASVRLNNIFLGKSEAVNREMANSKSENYNLILKQMQSLLEELKHSGTVDFILESTNASLVLSTQEQYLSNDNISEIIGGKFKILGKVIKVCKNSDESINLLRKTSLSVLNEQSLNAFLSALNASEVKQFNLPTVKFEILGPSTIVIPIAIYA